MSKPFLGIGTGFPLALDAKTHGVIRAEYEESVRQSILIILGTAKGERVMRPDFGCGIHDLVFATMSASTIGRIDREVHEALLRHEPRIDVLEIEVENAPEQPNLLLIRIAYRIRANQATGNLVYPFYIKEGA